MNLTTALAASVLAGLLSSCGDPYEEAPQASLEEAPSPFLREHALPDGPRIGWVERVLVCPGGHSLVARIDTGAKTSSIHAAEYNRFDRDGKKWIRFSGLDREKDPYTFEGEFVRMAKIKNRDGSHRERPVVKIGIVLADTYHETEVNLEDRSALNYRLLLGRSYLQQAGVVVNPSATFRTKPNPARVPLSP